MEVTISLYTSTSEEHKSNCVLTLWFWKSALRLCFWRHDSQ